MRDDVPAVGGILGDADDTLDDVGAEGIRSGGNDTLPKVEVELRGVTGVDVAAEAGDSVSGAVDSASGTAALLAA